VINEMPPGKKPGHTVVLPESKRDKVYQGHPRGNWTKGHQAFIVYPLVEESETLDLKDDHQYVQAFAAGRFSGLPRGIYPRENDGKEKDEIMRNLWRTKFIFSFRQRSIEVGNRCSESLINGYRACRTLRTFATHQLRGRVGAARYSSPAAFLLANYKCSADARKRLIVMETTTDGFTIAEEDPCYPRSRRFSGTRPYPGCRIPHCQYYSRCPYLSEARRTLSLWLRARSVSGQSCNINF
jgi:ATP-dependent DNA helicase RecG